MVSLGFAISAFTSSSTSWVGRQVRVLAGMRSSAPPNGGPISSRTKRQALGVSASRPRRRWSPEEVALLGTAYDGEIAGHFGRSQEAVRVKTVALGIPRERGPSRRAPAIGGR